MPAEPSLHSIDTKVAVLCAEFKELKAYVMGDGKKRGFSERLRSLENWRILIYGASITVLTVLGWLYHEGILVLVNH